MQAFHQRGVIGVGDEVVILVGVGAVVVEFGEAIAALGEAPAWGADGATVAPLAEGSGFAFGFGVVEEGRKLLPSSESGAGSPAKSQKVGKRSCSSTRPPLRDEADHFTHFTSTLGSSAFTLVCVSSG